MPEHTKHTHPVAYVASAGPCSPLARPLKHTLTSSSSWRARVCVAPRHGDVGHVGTEGGLCFVFLIGTNCVPNESSSPWLRSRAAPAAYIMRAEAAVT